MAPHNTSCAMEEMSKQMLVKLQECQVLIDDITIVLHQIAFELEALKMTIYNVDYTIQKFGVRNSARMIV